MQQGGDTETRHCSHCPQAAGKTKGRKMVPKDEQSGGQDVAGRGRRRCLIASFGLAICLRERRLEQSTYEPRSAKALNFWPTNSGPKKYIFGEKKRDFFWHDFIENYNISFSLNNFHRKSPSSILKDPLVMIVDTFFFSIFFSDIYKI